METKRKQVSSILFWCVMTFLAACSSYPVDEEAENTSTAQCDLSLNVKSRVADEIPYPISIYLFDGEKNLITHQKLTDEETPFQQSLKAGTYILTAFTAGERKGYTFPDSPGYNSLIRLENPYFAESPLMAGSSTIKLENKTDASILLEYAMSSLNFTFNDIPQDATQVEVTVSPIRPGIDLLTDYSTERQSSTIPCVKNGDTWEGGPVYVFPAASQKTSLSITVSRLEGNKTYSYTYNQPLEPSQPYKFTGKYNDEEGVILTGQFEASDWKPAIDIEFGIGGNTSDGEEDGSGDNSGTPGSDIFYTNELPEADNIWGYFYVWKVKTVSEDEIIATLISPDQWYLLASDALPTLKTYAPDNITGWRTFTTEEAKEFREQFIGTLDELNDFLEENGMQIFYKYKDDDKGARHLCNNAQKTFSFVNTSILNAGTTVKYYLRGVKTVRIKKK